MHNGVVDACMCIYRCMYGCVVYLSVSMYLSIFISVCICLCLHVFGCMCACAYVLIRYTVDGNSRYGGHSSDCLSWRMFWFGIEITIVHVRTNLAHTHTDKITQRRFWSFHQVDIRAEACWRRFIVFAVQKQRREFHGGNSSYGETVVFFW